VVMNDRRYKYLYGPVASWRLGSSLGIDPVSQKEKVCSFDCVYCQVGRTGRLTARRKMFVPTDAVMEELASVPDLRIDYITFSGAGEPTLARNLGGMIRAVRAARPERIAVITNASLMHREDVRSDLAAADLVLAKLDAPDPAVFRSINKPARGIELDKVLGGIGAFRGRHAAKVALQIMFIEENRHAAARLAAIVREIAPDVVELNTPLRPCAVRPLSRAAMAGIAKSFAGLPVVSVYDAPRKTVRSISAADTLARRGKSS